MLEVSRFFIYLLSSNRAFSCSWLLWGWMTEIFLDTEVDGVWFKTFALSKNSLFTKELLSFLCCHSVFCLHMFPEDFRNAFYRFLFCSLFLRLLNPSIGRDIVPNKSASGAGYVWGGFNFFRFCGSSMQAVFEEGLFQAVPSEFLLNAACISSSKREAFSFFQVDS